MCHCTNKIQSNFWNSAYFETLLLICGLKWNKILLWLWITHILISSKPTHDCIYDDLQSKLWRQSANLRKRRASYPMQAKKQANKEDPNLPITAHKHELWVCWSEHLFPSWEFNYKMIDVSGKRTWLSRVCLEVKSAITFETKKTVTAC